MSEKLVWNLLLKTCAFFRHFNARNCLGVRVTSTTFIEKNLCQTFIFWIDGHLDDIFEHVTLSSNVLYQKYYITVFLLPTPIYEAIGKKFSIMTLFSFRHRFKICLFLLNLQWFGKYNQILITDPLNVFFISCSITRIEGCMACIGDTIVETHRSYRQYQ